ncbi:hypothetical protein B7991_08850 [Fibrobacter sp. UWB3]|jgi:hypothetical protein|nr:hypothetical protein B7991_08850 [Fibrobacter sp. UWB3]
MSSIGETEFFSEEEDAILEDIATTDDEDSSALEAPGAGSEYATGTSKLTGFDSLQASSVNDKNADKAIAVFEKKF